MRFGTVRAYLCHRDDQNGTTLPVDHDSTSGCRGWVANTPYSECYEFESQLGGRLIGIVRGFTLFINTKYPEFESFTLFINTDHPEFKSFTLFINTDYPEFESFTLFINTNHPEFESFTLFINTNHPEFESYII